MKFLIIVCCICLFCVCSWLTFSCRGTSQIVENDPVKDSFKWDGIERMERMERMRWYSAHSDIEEEDDDTPNVFDVYYVKDERTGLCFAIYKNFGFQRVPCSFAEGAM